MARVSANSFDDDQYQDSPYDLAYDYPRRARHSGRPRPDYYDEHLDLYDDDLPFEGHTLLDKIQHLKRLQGQGECQDGAQDSRGAHRGSYRGGYGRGSGHLHGDDLLPSSSLDSKSGSDSKMHRKKSGKDGSDKEEGEKRDDSDFDFDLGADDEDEHEYDFGPVKGLSNQIEHVKQLRRLPPFKDLRAKRSRTTSLPVHDLKEASADQQLVAQKHERGDVSLEVKPDKPEDKP